MGMSTFAAEYWYIVVAMIAAAVVGFRLFVRDPEGRYRWDKLKLRTPVVGPIVRCAALAQICRSFALTLEAGLPVIQALTHDRARIRQRVLDASACSRCATASSAARACIERRRRPTCSRRSRCR